MWWRITAPHFVAALRVKDGRVVEAANILGWAVGKRWPEVKRYMRRKGWHGAVLAGAKR